MKNDRQTKKEVLKNSDDSSISKSFDPDNEEG